MRRSITFITVLLLVVATQPTWAQTTPSVTGTVQQYLLNPHGEVDGLLLSDSTAVRFAPHLGITLATSVKSGDAVTAVGFLGPPTSQGRAMKALSITNMKTGQTLVDEPPTTPPLPPHLRGLPNTPLTVSGTVAHFLVNPHGDIDRLILNGGEQITFKPHQGALIVLALAHVPGPVSVTGFGTKNTFGTSLEGDFITAEGQTVWTREW